MRSYERAFKDPKKLEEMIALRKLGWNLSQLARFYGTDHTSIRHWVVKFDLVHIEIKRVGEICDLPRERLLTPKEPESDWYTDEWGDRIFKGKSYGQIHAEAEERRKRIPPQRAQFYIDLRGI